MEQKKYTFEVVGMSPLLQHNPAGSMKLAKKGLSKKNIPEPEDEAEAGVYRTPDGEFGAPVIWFRAAMLEAAKGERIGKIGAKSVISGGVMMEDIDEVVPLLNAENGMEPIEEYEIDIRRAKVQNAGVLRSRPRFKGWGCRFDLIVDEEIISMKDHVIPLLQKAGVVCGVGDFRPQKMGTFGRFRVVAYEANGVREELEEK